MIIVADGSGLNAVMLTISFLYELFSEKDIDLTLPEDSSPRKIFEVTSAELVLTFFVCNSCAVTWSLMVSAKTGVDKREISVPVKTVLNILEDKTPFSFFEFSIRFVINSLLHNLFFNLIMRVSPLSYLGYNTYYHTIKGEEDAP